MPLKFWKREKPAKEKEGPGGDKEKEVPAKETPAEPKIAAPPAAPETTAAPPVKPEDIEATAAEVHAGLVDLGLTIPGTKGVFLKKLSGFPGGSAAFVTLYKEAPHRAATRLLADWLGFGASLDFDPPKLLEQINLRLSSFKASVSMSDVSWLDEELGLRKARMRLAEQERVVRFKDARDFVKGVNELLAPRKLVFLELETWADDYTFLLAREPKWDKLAATTLIVVKAPQTAVGGECGECGAPVGTNWHDCLSCGAVFG